MLLIGISTISIGGIISFVIDPGEHGSFSNEKIIVNMHSITKYLYIDNCFGYFHCTIYWSDK